MCTTPQCACETWSLSAEDVGCVEVFNYRCLGGISGIGWSVRVRNAKVKNRVFGASSENSLSKLIEPSRLRCLVHGPLKINACLLCCALEKSRVGQWIMWHHGMGKRHFMSS